MRDIIRATPLASGTFYNYFKSKEEVFQAIQDESALRIRPRLREERAKAATIEEFISGTFRTFLEFVAGDEVNFHAIRRNTDTMRVRMDTPEDHRRLRGTARGPRKAPSPRASFRRSMPTI